MTRMAIGSAAAAAIGAAAMVRAAAGPRRGGAGGSVSERGLGAHERDAVAIAIELDAALDGADDAGPPGAVLDAVQVEGERAGAEVELAAEARALVDPPRFVRVAGAQRPRLANMDHILPCWLCNSLVPLSGRTSALHTPT